MMKTLDRYVGISFIQYSLLVLSGLGFLFSFLEFIGQLDDIGRGDYQLEDAFFFVLLTLPGRILDLIPVSSLLGGIIALGLLADHNELLAMRAGGISVRRICWSVISVAALPMLTAAVLAEFIVPPLEQHARAQRLTALSETDITFTSSGFWAHNAPFFIHVGTAEHRGIPADVDIFELDQDGRLRVFTHARVAVITEDNQWVLTDVVQKTIAGQRFTTQRVPRLILTSFLSAEQMAIQELPPESLSPSDLYHYVRLLQERGQNADQYDLVFWQKLSNPLVTGALVLLSLTFVFGPTRGLTAGFRIMMGSIVGVVLYFLNQILGNVGLLLELDLALMAMAPAAAILCVALWLLSRAP